MKNRKTDEKIDYQQPPLGICDTRAWKKHGIQKGEASLYC